MDIEYVNESSLTTFWSRIKSVLITPLSTRLTSLQTAESSNKSNLQDQLDSLSARILTLENNSGGSSGGGGTTTLRSYIDETNMIIYGFKDETLDLGWTPDHFRRQDYSVFGASTTDTSVSNRISMSGSKMSFIGTANKNWSYGISGSVSGLASSSNETGCWFWTYKTSSIKYKTIINE